MQKLWAESAETARITRVVVEGDGDVTIVASRAAQSSVWAESGSRHSLLPDLDASAIVQVRNGVMYIRPPGDGVQLKVNVPASAVVDAEMGAGSLDILGMRSSVFVDGGDADVHMFDVHTGPRGVIEIEDSGHVSASSIAADSITIDSQGGVYVNRAEAYESSESGSGRQGTIEITSDVQASIWGADAEKLDVLVTDSDPSDVRAVNSVREFGAISVERSRASEGRRASSEGDINVTETTADSLKAVTTSTEDEVIVEDSQIDEVDIDEGGDATPS